MVAVVGAHALTYLLVGVLPDAAVVSLGIEGTKQEVLAAYQSVHETRSYAKVIVDLIHFDLGQTLDGVPVVKEIMDALSYSAPRLTLSFILVSGVVTAAALLPPSQTADPVVASFLAFLPPYVMPFIGLVLVLYLGFALNLSLSDSVTQAIVIATLAIAPAALVWSQTRKIAHRNLSTDFARTLLSIGATPLIQRFRLLNNVIAELAPSLEKVFTGLVSVLLFVEPIYGLSGFGTTAIRAIRRSDTDLLLGLVLILALSVAAFRMLSIIVRRHYHMPI